ncbi:MAG: hypothetical protein ACREJQ_04025 [bacterium]
MAEHPQEWNSFFFELDSFLSRLPAIATEVASKDPKSAPLPEYIGAVANSVQQYAAEVLDRRIGTEITEEQASQIVALLGASQGARVLRAGVNVATQQPLPQKIPIMKRALGAAVHVMGGLSAAVGHPADLEALYRSLAALESLV